MKKRTPFIRSFASALYTRKLFRYEISRELPSHFRVITEEHLYGCKWKAR